MLQWADSNGLRICGYLLVVALCLLARLREPRHHPSTWRWFWPLTAILFLIMAVGRAGGLAEWAVDQLRSEAYDDGWYERRRRLQGAVVVVFGLGWTSSVVLIGWRTPARRRRYVPMTIVSVTVAAFAAIRSVSLHQVDSVLYRHFVAGAKVSSVCEVLLVMLACATTFWPPQAWRPDDASRSASITDRVEASV